MKSSEVLTWPFWWVISTFWQIFTDYDLPLKCNDIPDGIFNEVSEWPLIPNQYDYSEWAVCVCVQSASVGVPNSRHARFKEKVGDPLRKQLQGGETVSRMGRVEWWTFSYLVFYGMCLISKAETKESLFIYSFTYPFSFVQQVFLSIHGTTSCAEKRRVKKTTALGSCHLGDKWWEEVRATGRGAIL